MKDIILAAIWAFIIYCLLFGDMDYKTIRRVAILACIVSMNHYLLNYLNK